MNIYEKQQCETIINNAKVKAGIKGSKISLSNIMRNMVIEIGYVFGYDVSQNMPSDLKTEILAFTVGSSANRLLTGWIPIVGKAVNNSSAALCTEEVGRKAANFFDSL